MRPSIVSVVAKTGKATEARIAELYRNGQAIDAIAEAIGVNRSTVWRIVKSWVAAGELKLREERVLCDDEVIRLRLAGMPGGAIAEKLGFSKSHVHKAITRLVAEGRLDRVDVRNDEIARRKLEAPDTPPIVRMLLSYRLPGENLDSLTVLTGKLDPYRIDTPEKTKAAHWLRDAIADLDARRGDRRVWWNRGLHYALLGRIKPDGSPYVNTEADWLWLETMASKAARWSGLVGFERIDDRKNNPPTIRLAEEIDPTPQTGHALDAVDDLRPSAWLDDFAALQPYRIALVAEKSSAGDVLGPLSIRYRTDLFLPDGEMTDTMIHRMAQAADDDGRPLIVLYFSDADPSGYQMPISVSRKLQALNDIEFPFLEFRVVQAAMLPEQVRDYAERGDPLPETPLKEGEKRADAWTEMFGILQTELDSLTSLRPDDFEQIAVEAIEQFYDTELEAEVKQLRDEWTEAAQELVDEQADSGEQQRLRREAQAALGALRDRIEADLDEIEESLPEVPELPESDLDPGEVPNTVIDSADDWRTQTFKLKDRKRYLVDDIG